jgi:hypothetical protein
VEDYRPGRNKTYGQNQDDPVFFVCFNCVFFDFKLTKLKASESREKGERKKALTRQG